MSVVFFTAVWIQPGEMDYNWEAVSASGPILPSLLDDVLQPSGESQGWPQEQGQRGPKPSAPQ